MDLIHVKVNRVIQAKRWKVLRLISRIEDFPYFMPNIKQCLVIEKKGCRSVTSWNVEIDKIPFSWNEEDIFDFENFTVRFRAISGDLACFEGQWKLEEAPGGTNVTVEVKVGIGLPEVEKIIGGVLVGKIRKNFEMMLTAIEERLTLQRYKNIRHRKVSDIKGFAVIGHPYNLQHLVQYFKSKDPDFRPPSEQFLVKVFEMAPSFTTYEIKNFKSKTGKEVNGHFIACTIIPDMLMLKPEQVVEKVVDACKLAERLGVGIVTLGGFTSIVGERHNKPLSSLVNVPVTTGNTFTVAMAVDGVLRAAEKLEVDLSKAKLTVVGGAGDIGSACARILSEKVAEITITGRSEKSLMEAERLLSYYGKARIHTSRDNNEAVRGADIVIAAASSTHTIVDLNNFKPGAIVCDIGYPKNISYTECDRRDILIFSGGLASIPSEFNAGFDVGLPSANVLYGCFCEGIILALEERFENFSWGKGNITKEKVDFIRDLGKKHGFELAPFFWGHQLLTENDIQKILAAKSASHQYVP